MAMELLVTFLLFTTVAFPLSWLASTSQAASVSTDQLALLSFKKFVSDDPNGVLKSWGRAASNVSYCQWHGVKCGSRGRRRGRVTALELPGLNISGIISPALANLTFLRSLDLSQNHLHGSLPHEFSLLQNLNHFDLSFNTLDGEIPPSLSRCSNLRNISLGFNNLQEYGSGNEVSIQGDIFSYGLLLLELFTAKRPTDDAFMEGYTLHQYVEMALGHKTTEIIDQSLFLTEHSGAFKSDITNKEETYIACITSVLTIGIQCSKAETTERMQIAHVLRELHRIRENVNQQY